MSHTHRSRRFLGFPLAALLLALPLAGGIHCSGSSGDDDATAGGDDDVSQAGDDDASGDDDVTAGDDDASAGDDDASQSGDDDATGPGDDDTTTSSGCTTQMLSCAYVQKHVFTPSCSSGESGNCHSGPKPTGDMNLNAACDSNNSSVINVPPSNAAARNDGLVRVQPGDLAKSFLWIKVSTPQGEMPPTYGQIMPPTLAQLPLDEQNIIKCWIEGGAQIP